MLIVMTSANAYNTSTVDQSSRSIGSCSKAVTGVEGRRAIVPSSRVATKRRMHR
jgi:hypothetical protein